MSWFTDLYRSAVGKKAVMAVTGILLFGFVVCASDRQPEAVRARPVQGCRARPARRSATSTPTATSCATWASRRSPPRERSGSPASVLLAAVVLHIWAAWQLTRMSRAARPRGYAVTAQGPHPLRLAHHALGRRDHPALRHLPPAATSRPARVNPGFVEGDVYRNVVAELHASGTCRCSTSWRRWRSASTSTTGSGACSSRWAGTIRASTAGAAASPTPSPGSSRSATSRFPLAVLTGLVR